MKSTLKLLFVAALLTFLSTSKLQAQDYKNAIGLRGGFWSGITFKHINAGNKGYEFILSPRFRGFGLTGLYEVYKPAFNTPRLHWYYGGGAHISSYNYSFYRNNERTGTALGLGANGIIGLEYNIGAIPLNISVDLLPTVPIVPFFDAYIDGALSLRFYF
ncbi:MAG TPA: hypothetical protein VFV37_02120 [Luteibaculaceae bacterium]|jgi:hypothetical protein|nr:hypothetical protein [Luteibaculaceae bacterium]